MAVYTQVSAEAASVFLSQYDVGKLIALKGIAEGVQNSNYFLETDQGQFILTLYEKNVDPNDLPYFHSLLAHLHAAGCKVPRFIEDRSGGWLRNIAGRPAGLIEFLSGVSVSTPSEKQAYETGAALGQLHEALSDFTQIRANILGVNDFRPLSQKCGNANLDSILPGLAGRISRECDYLEENWPSHLPVSAIHADLFPDNVLMGDTVSGLIDFYFACNDVRGYDIAITHAAWCFSADGKTFDYKISAAILHGYNSIYPITDEVRDALPILARAASIRFLLTRAYDWINTPADALVTRKDPIAFLKRLDFYNENVNIFAK
jgi:homoserine kinase type II